MCYALVPCFVRVLDDPSAKQSVGPLISLHAKVNITRSASDREAL